LNVVRVSEAFRHILHVRIKIYIHQKYFGFHLNWVGLIWNEVHAIGTTAHTTLIVPREGQSIDIINTGRIKVIAAARGRHGIPDHIFIECGAFNGGYKG
jgi:hypothetical protein